ncbi:DUF3231 family protein [Alicyclobacillus fastidiosus]|uniref:DUF3231 family protein n=1 Tax=Alicyclobacillus fastidiosus TaxID=392011 RepID=A0ABY6ZMB5_9BACL|nr:DUF3231 family protein [Alicyclobacillus fastidiosus]WAH43341.1 DUF3231 family protein [Alicyclobacillus fastidiosus]GMA65400.1 hypothetical protein GCM10025859_58400 [Alicyclobacillus fastidiosus]
MEHNAQLTSAELGYLWTAYITDTASICIFNHFLRHIDDADIRLILEQARSQSRGHVETLAQFFNEEGFPVPKGFTDDDVNLDAPRLFTDVFYIHYLYTTAMTSLTVYALAKSASTRKDVRRYFSSCIGEMDILYDNCVALMLAKGVYIRAPIISMPDKVDFVKKQSFLSGFRGERRVPSIECARDHALAHEHSKERARKVAHYRVRASGKVTESSPAF